MKPLILLTCLLISWTAAAAEKSQGAVARDKEPESGLVEALLTPAELGPNCYRWIRLLLDPQSRPTTFYPSKDDMPGHPYVAPDPIDPALPFKRERDGVGAQAVVYLMYSFQGHEYYLKILRFPTAKAAEEYWQVRGTEGKSHLIGTLAGNVRYTEAGQQLRPGLNARMDTVECCDGKYVVRLAPERPGPLKNNPGLDLLAKQMEKIRKLGEPAAGGNAE